MNPLNFTNITSATTTVVKSGRGTLAKIIVNTTAAGAITVYDNTSAAGTKIATLKTSIAEGSFEFNCRFMTGLTVVTAAASDVTVIWE